MSISTNCMIVNLSMGAWQGYRLDKLASKQVTDNAGANDDAARVNKHLIPREALKAVTTAYGLIRAHLYAKTLPWKDNGDRVLTRKMYASFMTQHEVLVGEFNDAVEVFLTRTYPEARARAEFRMGTLFDENDYPNAEELRGKFYVNLSIDAVTEASDFRVTLDDAAVAEIQASMDAAMNARLGRAMADVWDRLSQTLTHFVTKLGDETAVFRDTTITNLQELVEILPGLNLTGDTNMTRIYKELRALVSSCTPKELRKDKDMRDGVVAEAADIMETMKGFMRSFGGV